jgi:hypothetical protein
VERAPGSLGEAKETSKLRCECENSPEKKSMGWVKLCMGQIAQGEDGVSLLQDLCFLIYQADCFQNPYLWL